MFEIERNRRLKIRRFARLVRKTFQELQTYPAIDSHSPKPSELAPKSRYGRAMRRNRRPVYRYARHTYSFRPIGARWSRVFPLIMANWYASDDQLRTNRKLGIKSIWRGIGRNPVEWKKFARRFIVFSLTVIQWSGADRG